MKQKIKKKLAEIVYKQNCKKEPAVRVMSMDQTLDELLHSQKSLVRFGDGEIIMIEGKNLQLQKASEELSKRLKKILSYEHDNLMIAVPDIFDGVEQFRRSGQEFWKDHLLFFRQVYKKNCNRKRIYGNAYVSRCYYNYADKSRSRDWFQKMKDIWKGKDIVVVEGERTHNGVGNDLFLEAKSVQRIIAPSSDAFAKYQEILEACREFSKDKLFLLSLGAAAKPLGEDLFLDGYRVIDIGNLDMEYEWFLNGVDEKIKLKKHDVVGKEENISSGYLEYWEEIANQIV